MNKRLPFLLHFWAREKKMKVIILVINVFVLVKTQNETSSIISSPNNTELATSTTVDSTTANFTNISITSTTTTNLLNTVTNSTTQQETSLTSPPPNNTEQTTATPTPLTTNTLPEDWPQTKILAKKNANLRDHADKSVQIASPSDGDFLSFIRHSSLWVDKSLLIPKICGVWKDGSTTVKLYDSVMFPTAPPKWGKTINLSMLKFYFELPINSDGFPTPRNQSASYRYFKEGKVVLEDDSVEDLDGIPLISNYDSRDLANHPVIFIQGANFTGDKDSFRSMIHETYHRHEGLRKRLTLKQQNAEPNSTDYRIASEDLQDFLTFYDWHKIKKQCPEAKLLTSIEILSKLLAQTYESPAVILYDDYDHYIYNTFFNLDHFDLSISTNNFSDYFEIFLSNTFKFNVHRTTAVITGVVRANFPPHFAVFDNYHRSYVDFCSLFPFYGIFQNEFDQMIHKRGIDRALVENATQWYGGYRTMGHLDIPMYSTHSVARFISTLQVQDYWPKSHPIGKFIDQLLRRDELQQDVQEFIRSLDGNRISSGILYSRFRKLSLEDYKVIRLVQMGLIGYYDSKIQYEYVHIRHRDLIFSLMVSEGYAAVHENQTGGSYGIPNLVHITLPNREIYSQLANLTNSR